MQFNHGHTGANRISTNDGSCRRKVGLAISVCAVNYFRPCGILDLEEEERVTLGHIAGEGQSHVVDVTRRCRKICTVIAHRDRCGNLLSKSQVLGHDKLVPSLRFF